MSALVESYAEQAIRRWHAKDELHSRRGRGERHDRRVCACLTCADGRAALGLRPLLPLFARWGREQGRPA